MRSSPASAMRAGSVAITDSRSVLSILCQRAISGSVRPQPKQSFVLGSIMQTAIHGVSELIVQVLNGFGGRCKPADVGCRITPRHFVASMVLARMPWVYCRSVFERSGYRFA